MEFLFSVLDRVPEKLRPAVVGAILLVAIVCFRVLFALPRLLRAPAETIDVIAVIGAAGLAGAVGGLAYSFVGAPLGRIQKIGPYLTGVVTVFAYMGALVLVAPILFGEKLVDVPGKAVAFVVVSVFFGLLMGHTWFRE